jgi:predicted lipoprotein with Yx(FWY)xxD motif
MRKRLLVGLLLVAAVAPASLSAAPERSRAAVTVKPSQYGRVLFDGRGFVLYGFTRDSRRKSLCSGACAKAWPPYIVKLRPRAGTGVAAARLGVIKRADGRLQATYAGHPLYYYVGDTRPGQILCHNVSEFGGIWRVVRPSGRLVR